MTEKEKANELLVKFTGLVECEIAGENGFEFSKKMQVDNSKKCALIAVDEILSMKIVRKDDLTDEYWEKVKKEIEKI